MPATLTTAVIDALRGAPAKGMLVDVFRLPRGAGDDLVVPATYELLYHIGRYFKAQRAPLEDGPFLDVVPVRFALTDPNRACHLALMVTPLSYAVYRA